MRQPCPHDAPHYPRHDTLPASPYSPYYIPYNPISPPSDLPLTYLPAYQPIPPSLTRLLLY